MMRCWCHAAMTGWLGAWAQGLERPSPGQLWRWQHECERAGGDCAARVEAVALRLPTTRAVRQGGALRLYTATGTADFIDVRSARPRQHRYLGLVDSLMLHLVWRRDTDGVAFIAVDELTGTQSEFASLSELPAAVPAWAAARAERPTTRPS